MYRKKKRKTKLFSLHANATRMVTAKLFALYANATRSQWQFKWLCYEPSGSLRENQNKETEMCLKCTSKHVKISSTKFQWLLLILILPENYFGTFKV